MGEDGGGTSDDYDPHGDPKADPRERRRIRHEYRELIAETQSKNSSGDIFVLHSCVYGFVPCILKLYSINWRPCEEMSVLLGCEVPTSSFYASLHMHGWCF